MSLPLHQLIPNLFLDSLEQSCTGQIIRNLIHAGVKVERESKRRKRTKVVNLNNDDNLTDLSFIDSDYFAASVNEAREFLVSFLASNLLDKLSSEMTLPQGPGGIFCFSVICNDRLSKLVAQQHNNDSTFWNLPNADNLLIDCVHQLRGLSSLTIHNVCTNEILEAVAETCSRLQILDISYSGKVTDIGLVYLCGVSPSTFGGFDHFNSVRGCKFLRELYFLPQSDPDVRSRGQLMPKVVSYLLKNLNQLQVADLENLHSGIEYYFKGGQDGSYRPRPGRIAPLKLRFYTGSDDKLAEVLPICPKLTNFKLSVTGALKELSDVLKSSNNSLDRVALVFGLPDDRLNPFLQSCGYRISTLEIDLTTSAANSVSVEDFEIISRHCPLLDSLSVSGFHLDQPVEKIPSAPIKLNFLTSLRTFYFNDFFLDDILLVNTFGRLENFLLSEVSMTLISALRMISNRPKLRSLGQLLQWDVEVCELEAFATILRKAKSLNLLQDIAIL